MGKSRPYRPQPQLLTTIKHGKIQKPTNEAPQHVMRVVLRPFTDLLEEELGVRYHSGHRNGGVKHHHAGASIHPLAQR